ncbi:MAG: hypothetical protein ACR2LK_02175 [Solirubrobacteraceae bacterium]
MSALEAVAVPVERAADREWAATARRAPQLAATSRRYLDQITVSLAPRSVDAADNTLRLFVSFLDAEHPDVAAFADVGRDHIEGFKSWLRRRRAPSGGLLSANTIRQRLGTAIVLRPHHRVGLDRRPGSHTDLRRRPPHRR